MPRPATVLVPAKVRPRAATALGSATAPRPAMEPRLATVQRPATESRSVRVPSLATSLPGEGKALICGDCNVALCVKCWKVYHTKKCFAAKDYQDVLAS